MSNPLHSLTVWRLHCNRHQPTPSVYSLLMLCLACAAAIFTFSLFWGLFSFWSSAVETHDWLDWGQTTGPAKTWPVKNIPLFDHKKLELGSLSWCTALKRATSHFTVHLVWVCTPSTLKPYSFLLIFQSVFWWSNATKVHVTMTRSLPVWHSYFKDN